MSCHEAIISSIHSGPLITDSGRIALAEAPGGMIAAYQHLGEAQYIISDLSGPKWLLILRNMLP